MELTLIIFIFGALFLMLVLAKHWRVPRQRDHKPPTEWWGKK